MHGASLDSAARRRSKARTQERRGGLAGNLEQEAPGLPLITFCDRARQTRVVDVREPARRRTRSGSRQSRARQPGKRRRSESPAALPVLYVREKDGYHKAGEREILGRASDLVRRRFRPGSLVFAKTDRVHAFLRVQLGALEHEVLAVIFLDHRHRLIEYVELFRGTVCGTSVHAREVVKEALARNASAVILVHNHPSGTATPSPADEFTTRELKAALDIVDVEVLDHLIVGESILSFAERGLL